MKGKGSIKRTFLAIYPDSCYRVSLRSLLLIYSDDFSELMLNAVMALKAELFACGHRDMAAA